MKEESLFKSELIKMEIDKVSLPREHCVICFEDFSSSGGEIVLMPCSHIYIILVSPSGSRRHFEIPFKV